MLTRFPAAHSILHEPNFWAILVCECVILPISFLKQMKGIRYISYFTSLTLPLFVALAVGSFLQDQPDSYAEIKYASSSIEDVLKVFTLYFYGHYFQVSI